MMKRASSGRSTHLKGMTTTPNVDRPVRADQRHGFRDAKACPVSPRRRHVQHQHAPDGRDDLPERSVERASAHGGQIARRGDAPGGAARGFAAGLWRSVGAPDGACCGPHVGRCGCWWRWVLTGDVAVALCGEARFSPWLGSGRLWPCCLSGAVRWGRSPVGWCRPRSWGVGGGRGAPSSAAALAAVGA